MTFETRIQEKYSHFTPGFHKLADFILNHAVAVAFMSVLELSDKTGVKTATVKSFLREIGYSDYPELTTELKAFARAQFMTRAHKTKEVQTDDQLLWALQENAQQILRRFNATDIRTLAQMLAALRTASHVWVVGEFVMYELARFFAQELQFLAKPATAFNPSLMETAAYLTLMEPGQVVLALAVGHLGVDTGYAVRLAREKGLMTLCLTGNATILPARAAEITWVMATASSVSPGSMMLPLVVLNMFWEALVMDSPEKTAQIFTDVFSNIGQLRTWRATTQA